ncbi:MAG: ribonucleoside triphosphate reductase [Candidatus Diapherotrites archaeon]|uniref:Ribonucleoside triphosphate reductase n=1 Tax=Candidatus Iainarchaeum sp. TaxID=3101447 RepID=A0A2D6M1L6_9ARCH|nr:ribonucleoside triphosphate reductase [Candidatus Diapherotrites archaeon]|tara:strand:+ start:2516 stop:4528 length:2013 start_codon:yes stop_codon:yes gene_type:complete
MVKKFLESVQKRDGSLVPYSRKRIEDAIFAAAKSVGGQDKAKATEIAERIEHDLKKRFGTTPPSVEAVQDAVEKQLIETGHAKTAKAYILYRQKRAEMRDSAAFVKKVQNIIHGYVQESDWRVAENSNASYSLSGLQAHISGAVMAEYALQNVYPNEIAQAHRSGDFHIHDLGNGAFSGYCAGWSLRQLLELGFNGVPGRIAAKPAKHFNSALGQIVNFMGTLQNEWAGAQAFNSFDTYLAPLAKKDGLDYKKVKQSIQEFVFATNATSRWGNQVPFTNITLDWMVPDDMKDLPIMYGGKEIDNEYYADFQDEMDMVNKAFIEVMTAGDMNGRVFTFPIPTYNITKDFDWDSENAKALFDMTAKYGIPYFQNFINSSLKPSDVRSMCCRLQLDLRELKQKTGGLFGSGEQTGSIGVVTMNLPKLGYLSKDETDFFERLDTLLYLAKESLEIKRKEVSRHMDAGLLPWSKRFLGSLNNHFSTIGLVGMNEGTLNFLDAGIHTKTGRDFSLKVLDFFRDRLQDFQEETGHIYNIEATPAEGTSYRLARLDRRNYPEIKTAGKVEPFYTNSTQLPVDYTDDIFEALQHQDELQAKYTGGTVLHGFIGEAISNGESCAKLVKKIAYNFKLPYYTITPTFSVCPTHGYVKGMHTCCPKEVSGKNENPNKEVTLNV